MRELRKQNRDRFGDVAITFFVYAKMSHEIEKPVFRTDFDARRPPEDAAKFDSGIEPAAAALRALPQGRSRRVSYSGRWLRAARRRLRHRQFDGAERSSPSSLGGGDPRQDIRDDEESGENRQRTIRRRDRRPGKSGYTQNVNDVSTLFPVTIDLVYNKALLAGSKFYAGAGIGPYFGNITRFGGKVLVGFSPTSNLAAEAELHFPGDSELPPTVMLRLGL
jgi:hypothetical protein